MKLQEYQKNELKTVEDVVDVKLDIKKAENIIKKLKKISDDRARELLDPGETVRTDNGSIRINKDSEVITPEAVESILGEDFIFEEKKKKIDKKKIDLARDGKYGEIHPEQWDMLNESTEKKPGNIIVK